jgi:hypothetical protein
MKTIITAGVLALASTMAAASPMHPGGARDSQHTYNTGGGAGHALVVQPSTGLTSLDQFEWGDPDAVVTEGFTGAEGHSRPAGQAATSLARFEMGDPDTTPGG